MVRLLKGDRATTTPPLLSGTSTAGVAVLLASEVATVLGHLPPPPVTVTENFRFPAGPQPPSIGAVAVNGVPAPPVASSDAETPEPVIVRRSPEGDVESADRIAVTFASPVSAVTASRSIAPESAPFVLSPAVEGSWRWLSPETVVFEPVAGRLPMATAFRVVSQAGWSSVDGRRFLEPIVWHFRTPPPSVKAWYPAKKLVAPETVYAVLFDQPVDPDRVLSLIEVKSGAERLAIRALSDRERKQANRRIGWPKGALSDAMVAFTTRAPLPLDSTIEVSLPSGWRGREGPRRVAEEFRRTLITPLPLHVVSAGCGRGTCAPDDDIGVKFNHRLGADEGWLAGVRVEPAIANLEVSIDDFSVVLAGRTRPRTTYQITVPPTVTDAKRRVLGVAKTVRVRVGPEPADLDGAGERIVILDPAHRPQFEVYSVNYPRLQVRMWRAEPDQWPSFLALFESSGQLVDGVKRKPDFEQTVRVKLIEDRAVATSIDLTPVLGDGFGHAMISVAPPKEDLTPSLRKRPPVLRRWLTRSRLGLQTKTAADDILVWVTDLDTGVPVKGAKVEVVPGRARSLTDAAGLAHLTRPPKGNSRSLIVKASRGEDSVFLSLHDRYLEGLEYFDAFTFDDRRIYRPGESVSLKGWLRRVTLGGDGDVQALRRRAHTIEARVTDDRGVGLLQKTLRPNAWGGFDMAFDLPDDVNLGVATVEFRPQPADPDDDGEFGHPFLVESFRRPEFEVKVSSDAAPHRVGEYVVLTAHAGYYGGGGLADAPVEWSVATTEASYTPPGQQGYEFGLSAWSQVFDGYPEAAETTKTLKDRTDAAGRSRMRVDLLSVFPSRPMSMGISAQMTDVNRQTWFGEHSLLVHPSDLYVGLRSETSFVKTGASLPAEGIVVDIDGRPIAGHAVTATLTRLDWRWAGGQWRVVEQSPTSCSSTSRPDGQFVCRFRPMVAGRYRLTARVRDRRGRKNASSRIMWVVDEDTRRSSMAMTDGPSTQTLVVVSDRKAYAAGDIARILVEAPFPDGEGLLTVERGGVAHAIRFKMAGRNHVVEVPIKARYLPEVRVAVEVVGQVPRVRAPGQMRPAHANGEVSIHVTDAHRRLGVEVIPAKRVLGPGADTSVTVVVRDHRRRPVGDVEVAVMAVDEAVLSWS